MKVALNLARKGKSPNPPPNGNTGNVEARKRTLSKDERIDLLEQSFKECVKSIERVIHETIPVLLFIEKALDQDNEMEELVVHNTKYGDLNWCHSGNAVGEILARLSTNLAKCWDEIDGSDIHASRAIQSYRDLRLKAATSR